MASIGRMRVKFKQYFGVRRLSTFLTKLILLLLMAFIITSLLTSDAPRISFNDVNLAVGRLRGGDYFDRHKGFINPEKIDWHNYDLMMEESARHGIGEANDPTPPMLPEEELRKDEMFLANGYNARLSDQISVNRSVPDIRHKDCQKKQYLKDLPTASVIIPFYNEHFSSLLRTVHSVINRTPPQLLQEVILVNDHSTKAFLYEELRDYINDNFKNVHLIELPERSGLIRARMAGARAASGDVLVFLDSHCEANANWLPPLLEPIAANFRVCVCPFIDVINWKNYQYRSQDEGKRGVFDWKFFYKRIKIRPGDQQNPTDIFPSPVMAGGLFAISAKFFWELGGYDEGLDIWGGEQYELSFKIWQCGGAMYDAPCSRVGHLYRGHAPFSNPRNGTDFLSRNFKRVALVWMDEFAEYLYERRPSCRKVDPGDLTKQKEVRDQLQCKPFKWFLENVAPDLLEKYPIHEPLPFAKGAIQSIANSGLCIDTMGRGRDQDVGLYTCHSNLQQPGASQNWMLSHSRDVRTMESSLCLDVNGNSPKVIVKLFSCHESQGNQLLKYDLETKQLLSGKYAKRCLEADLETKKIVSVRCDVAKLEQKWNWGYVNHTALLGWHIYGAKLI